MTTLELGPDALDFWIGNWTITWPGGTGTNTIRRILQDAVIEENFECHDADGAFYGRSHSVFDRADQIWRQTWVDSTAAYLDFVGAEVDGRISFQRTSVVDGVPALQRMVWLDVTDDSLRWEWQRSTDAGANWMVMWPLDYRRATTLTA
jgi:hypothetical protein